MFSHSYFPLPPFPVGVVVGVGGVLVNLIIVIIGIGCGNINIHVGRDGRIVVVCECDGNIHGRGAQLGDSERPPSEQPAQTSAQS